MNYTYSGKCHHYRIFAGFIKVLEIFVYLKKMADLQFTTHSLQYIQLYILMKLML